MAKKKCQLHAGYKLKSLENLLAKEEYPVALKDLLHSLSTFECEIDTSNTISNVDNPIIAVLDNIISRGLPTYSSISIEKTIAEEFTISREPISDKTGDIIFKCNQLTESQKDLLYRSLFVVDPRINCDDTTLVFQSEEEYRDSDYEEFFFKLSLPDVFGSHLCQLIEFQRTVESIGKLTEREERDLQLGNFKNEFYRQRVDFALQFPKASEYENGLVIEIDGPQHGEDDQQHLDGRRDRFIDNCGWKKTVRIDTCEVEDVPERKRNEINDFISHPYAEQVKENYEDPIWERDWGLEALQIVLSPLGIARIQKTLVYLISSGILNLDAEKWNIAFIERDVPCANLAIEDFKNIVDNLFQLEGINRKLPDIECEVFSTPEFLDCQLNSKKEAKVFTDVETDCNVDAIIDISILQRRGFTGIPQAFIQRVRSHTRVVIRSCHSAKEDRVIKSSSPIRYEIQPEGDNEYLVYFLRNIFRKKDFREGQIDILCKSLALQNVLALLPTGAGKSLTYQLSALLQPGIVLVVDPLKSLMKDQDDNLKAAGIDSTTFINSSLKSISERVLRCEKMVRGHYQFVFISPERLQIQEFREYLRQMAEIYFSYCVVDEAHCVSEWGHDFRTAYLRLGENARKYCKTCDHNQKVPIIGLTGTASFDVLSDVQKELEIPDETAIVTPNEYERKELNFKIINVGIPVMPPNAKEGQIWKTVAEQKKLKLIELLSNLHQNNWDNGAVFKDISGFFSEDLEYKNSGIVFCPHIKNRYGVKEVRSQLVRKFPKLEPRTGMFAGGLSNDDAIDLEQIQNQFKSDELILLVATKAFGMGIDKPNIRFTVHFNMPQSIESFYQEAGRAGRDKDNAFCYILYSPALINKADTVDKSLMLSFFKAAFPGEAKERTILRELLNKITYPDSRKIDSIKEKVTQEFGEDYRLNIWILKTASGKTLNRLYVNEFVFSEKNYGYIDMYTEAICPERKPNNRIVPEEEARIILQEIHDFLIGIKDTGESFLGWLTHREIQAPRQGIEPTLEQNDYGSKTTITIGFKNRAFTNIGDLLGYDESTICDAYPYTNTWEEFLENVQKAPNVKKNLTKQQIASVKSLYPSLRDENETFKAIYRLSVIGVIDEYEVDYNKKTIKVIISLPHPLLIVSVCSVCSVCLVCSVCSVRFGINPASSGSTTNKLPLLGEFIHL